VIGLRRFDDSTAAYKAAAARGLLMGQDTAAVRPQRADRGLYDQRGARTCLGSVSIRVAANAAISSALTSRGMRDVTVPSAWICAS
jgi:hypothetical protein